MITRYLKGDPIPWLTDAAYPAAAYLARMEFTSSDTDDYILPEIPAHESSSAESGKLIPGNKKNIDLYYKGTLWHFLFAAESGYKSDSQFMNQTASFLIDRLSSQDEGFSLDWNPPLATGCRTGVIVRALIKSGCYAERAEKGLEWILKKQRSDGGWLHCPFTGICDSFRLILFKRPGRGIELENDINRKSCPVATAYCAGALIESGKAEFLPFINRAAEFFLSGGFFPAHDKQVLHCGQTISLSKAGYPLMTQIDAVSCLDIIFSSDLWNDKRGGSHFNELMIKQETGGIWKCENMNPGIIKGKGADRWVTLSVLRLLKKLAAMEDQLSKA